VIVQFASLDVAVDIAIASVPITYLGEMMLFQISMKLLERFS